MLPIDQQCDRTAGLTCGKLDPADIPVRIHSSRFETATGATEWHLAIEPTRYADFAQQLRWVEQAYNQSLGSLGIDDTTAIQRRFFCSDPLNQVPLLKARPFSHPRDVSQTCAVSWLGQSTIAPAKVALMAYHLVDERHPIEKTAHETGISVHRGELTHHWSTNVVDTSGNDSYEQTQVIFNAYEAFLQAHDLRLADHVIRTWFYVRNVDANYQGMVDARRELFSKRGLTPNTHYIASTGIAGMPSHVTVDVTMDAWAVEGLRNEQVRYIQALDNLSPTHVYGVTFERATAVSYRDRRHTLISGTASIDRDGQIVHPGNVVRQLDRTMDNVEALLSEAGATISDMSHLLVYLRDATDAAAIREAVAERVDDDLPVVMVVAPVCRPGWLVEVEGLAITPAEHPALPKL